MDAVCRHFGACGGCDWQDLAYADQLERKRRRLTTLLGDAIGAALPPVPPVIGMRPDASGWPWEFRHKASFVFGDAPDGRGAAIGHYGANSRQFVPVVECPVHASRANQVAFALQRHLAAARVSAAGPALRGILRHLIVRTTRDAREVVGMLVVTRNDKSLRAPIRSFLATEDAPDGFYLNIHDKASPYMVGRETMRLSGRSHVRETVAGASFLVSPTAFFQTNVEAAETLVQLVLDAAGERTGLHVLDLYAGSGLFAMPLARRGHHVTLIEENAQAVHDADANIRLNRIPPGRIRPLAARVEDALRRVRRDPVDLVVLDPPRQGCPPAVIRHVFQQIKPQAVVYVSCNPEALAEELPSIVDAGYRVTRVQAVDMFPHTTHIETVMHLEKRPAPRRTRQTISGTRPSRRAD
jgi:23S rRNA (uracil1939-C5)-methyltransferase